MITADLMGGLGNYMFQIGAASSLASEMGDDVEAIFDFSQAMQAHGSIYKYTSNILRNVNKGVVRYTNTYSEQPDWTHQEIPRIDSLKISGYFQSPKFLNREHALKLFSVDNESNKYITEKYHDLLEKNTVAIHVRRGDYTYLHHQHPVQSLEYYSSAIDMYHPDSIFVIFSDDIEWCKNVFIGDCFSFIEGEEDYIDMYLMSMCKHNIIANSSFSWWAAYLNTNKNQQVVAPSLWFGPALPLNTSNIYCKNWAIL